LLFDRKSTRKPQLTEAGRGVLSEARTITNGINGLRDKARSLRQDIEAEISLVLDVMLPAERMGDAAQGISRKLHSRWESPASTPYLA
jgi:DNA-binding transcriptional LysR family regulator